MMEARKDNDIILKYTELRNRLSNIKLLGCMKGDGIWSIRVCPIVEFCQNYNREFYDKLSFYRDVRNWDIRHRDKLDELEELLDSIDSTIKECPLIKLITL